MPDKFCLAPSGVGQRHRRCTIRYDLAVDDGARDVEALHLVTDSGATRKTRSTRRADVPPLAEDSRMGAPAPAAARWMAGRTSFR